MLDPTYLRYIYDNLIKGSVHPDNASELPDGLIGLYEEAFEENFPILQRQKLLKRFALFALLKKEVSANFVAEVLEENETEILEFINSYTSWFNSPEPGKFQLYHERLIIFILQKISSFDTKMVNDCLIKCLHSHLSKENSSEIEIYALQFLSHHLKVHYLISNDIEPLMSFLKDKSYWARQVIHSKGYFWTLSGLRNGINMALFAKKDHYVIQHAINYLSVESNLFNDIDSLINNLEEGRFEISTNQITYVESMNFEKFQLLLVYLLCYSLIKTDSEEKINILKGVECFMKTYNKKIDLELLPDSIRFDLANFCFNHNLPYTYLYPNDIIDIGEKQFSGVKSILLDLSKYEAFIIHLFTVHQGKISSRFKDSILFSALKFRNITLIELILQTDLFHYSEETAELLALHFFEENKPDEFYTLIKSNEEYIHMLLTLTMRMFLKGKYQKTVEFIDKVPNDFYQLIIFFYLAQAIMLLGKNEEFESILSFLKNEQRFNPEGSSDLISILELKKYIAKYPEEAQQFINSDTITINHVIASLGLDSSTLQFFRSTKLNLYNLNQLSINRISKLLGVEGATDEFISEKRAELKRNSNALFSGGYNWEDESVLFFVRGLAEKKLKKEFLKLFKFLIGPENLGVLYKLNPERIKYGLLFFLYSSLIKDKSQEKALVIRGIIQNELSNSTLVDLPNEVTRMYFDMMFKEGQFFESVIEKLKSISISSKVSWDSDYCLAKIAAEYLDRGDGEKGYIALKATHPSRWKINVVKASIQWQKITNKFLDYFIIHQNLECGLEIARRAINPSEMLHKLSSEIQIIDEDSKELLRSMMRTYVKKLDVDHYDRISIEVKHRKYFTGLILEAELLHQLYGKEEGRKVYSDICENLSIIKNQDDLQTVLNKLCCSLVKNHCVELYPFVINNLHVIDNVVVPFVIKDWNNTLSLFRQALLSNGDSESVSIIDSKIALLAPQEKTTKSSSKKVVKHESNGYYLLPFENYRCSLYNASSDSMLNSIIRHASYECFENILNEKSNFDELSDLLQLRNWILIGLEMNFHKNNEGEI